MNEFYKRALLPLLFLVCCASSLVAQTTISGTVKDTGTGEALGGVNIIVKGSIAGTISDKDGNFNLKVNQAPPFTIALSFVGYKTQEIEVSNTNAGTIAVSLEEQNLLGQEVVVSASRVEESIMQSPVTIEKMDIIAFKQAPAPDFYDALSSVKGVQTTTGSLNMTSLNTRGFATINNIRFVQWVDGMDTQAPLLNFPTGNIVGIGELDTESAELIPGAASALYGPNAFNGILIMNSKSPFLYQGLSAQVKQGITTSEGGGSHPLGLYAIRYAKAFNNKFAFKINFNYQTATDWLGNDYVTDRSNPESTVNLSGNPNFDGLNLYGDELQIATPVASVGTITRTGFKEEEMLKSFTDNRDATSIKGDLALHYRINDKIEALYNYRYGGGNSIYQGTEKYVLRDFNQQFHKLELKGDNFFVRGYRTATDAGKSYNLSALGAYANETYSPSAAQWVPDYIKAMQGYKEDAAYTGSVIAGNHASARAYADRYRPQFGTDAYSDLMKQVRSQVFQGTPPGASFYDNSYLYHGEFNYKFFNQIKWAEIQVGGNFRQYSLFSKGTVFNEAPDDGVDFKRIKINEYGAYAQIAKTFAESLKLTGSLRYDKNQNFEGFITPRISAVYTVAQNHNIRGSFQTGFRNPETQAQYIYFPSTTGTLLGSVKDNAERYGVHNGGAYTLASFNAYRASGGSLNATTGAPTGGNAALLETADIAYVSPEKLSAYEIGYKGLMASKLLLDVNGYYTHYQDFIGGQLIVSKNATSHQGKPVSAGTTYAPYVNSSEKVKSYGVGVGVSYSLPQNFVFNGSYNWATFEANESADFKAGFNTPKNKFAVGLSNRKLMKDLGFSVNFRWQEEFLWQSTYGEWNVPEYGVLDAQVSYKLTPIKTVIKIGGTNLGGGDYRTNLGSPFIGQQYYISLTFDEFLK